MKNTIKIFITLFMLASLYMPLTAQVTGMSDVTIYLDPGHALKENGGLYNYTEAEKTLRVALAIKDYFRNYTDINIDHVYLCREDDNTQITLTQRTDMANALNVDFYYSIHSDAGGTSVNSTLFMYGGWNSGGVTFEKTPYGGKAFGEIFNPNLTSAMRLTSRGSMADRINYDGNLNTHLNLYPYLHVNRESNMASLLSEAGFHTNPLQQQRNLNAEWKRLEGLATFQSLVKYFGATPPAMGIATGFLKDSESGVYANDVTITIGDKSYTTDSYESLFKNYSIDPEELHNGFYFIEGLTPGQTYDVTITSPYFQTKTTTLTIVNFDPAKTTFENFSVLDADLISSVPPKVVDVSAPNARDLNAVIKKYPLSLTFSRPMDKASVESAISIVPNAALTYTWTDNTININITALSDETPYTLTIDATKAKNTQTNQFIDGNADGVGGDDYALTFTTAPPDREAPEIVLTEPGNEGIAKQARSIIRIEYDEVITAESVLPNQITLTPAVNGVVQRGVAGDRSALHFIPTEDLADYTAYTVNIAAGLKDQFGNTTTEKSFTFSTDIEKLNEVKSLDNFDALVGWWALSGAGQTLGLLSTSGVSTSSTYASDSNTGKSAKIVYNWDQAHSAPFIRWYWPPANANVAAKQFNEKYVLRTYVFGDGTGNKIRYNIRDGKNTYEASKWFALDWVGWKLMEWDLTKGECFAWINGDGKLDPPGSQFYLDSYQMSPATGSPGGVIYLDNLQAVIVGAKTPVKIDDPDAGKGIDVHTTANLIKVSAETNINEVKVYSLAGLLVKSAEPNQTAYELGSNDLPKGIYIVKVTTETAQKNVKVVVK